MKESFKPVIDELFGTDEKGYKDWLSFHDVLAEITPREYTLEECRVAFDRLPDNIQFLALEWGLSDTVFRDDAYVWLKNNGGV
jgi:hypothetical protein